MRHPSYENTGPTPPTSATSESSPSTAPRASSSSRAASPARTSVAPGSRPDSTESDPGSGLSTRRSSRGSGRGSSSSRTSRGSGTTGSIGSSGTLPIAGTMRNGTFFPLPASAPRTSAKGSGSSPGTPHVCEYPTPSASTYGSSGNGTGNNVASRGRMSLESMARHNAWPTWPTPCARDGKGARPEGYTETGQHGGLLLPEAVNRWPTPRATDGTKGGPNQRGSKGDLMLPSAVNRWPTPGSASSTPPPMPPGPPDASVKSGPGRLGRPVLNPDWVEMLMGIPQSWTLVPRIPGNATRRGR